MKDLGTNVFQEMTYIPQQLTLFFVYLLYERLTRSLLIHFPFPCWAKDLLNMLGLNNISMKEKWVWEDSLEKNSLKVAAEQKLFPWACKTLVS